MFSKERFDFDSVTSESMSKEFFNTYFPDRKKFGILIPELTELVLHYLISFVKTNHNIKFFFDDKKYGRWLKRYDKKTIRSCVTYKNDEKEGERVIFHRNGRLKSFETFRNDKIIMKKTWFPNGAIKEVSNYKDGIFPGKKLLYSPVGLEYEFNYKDGVEHGKSRYYDPSTGMVVTIIHHYTGFLHGWKVVFDTEGQIMELKTYDHTMEHGPYRLWMNG